ncbi:MAG: DUF5915 domain-containing protein, partial [Acidimicrobiales bacterium]
VYRGLTGAESVHLSGWPAPGHLAADPALVADMDLVRRVCSAASSVRKANGRRNRLPLARVTVAMPRAERLRPFEWLIADEVNVKEVVLTEDVGALGDEVLTVVPGVLGPRVGPAVQDIIRAVKSGSWARSGDAVVAAGHTLAGDEHSLRLVPRDPASTAALPADRGLVHLDLEVTPALEAEGIARDVSRLVNQVRRDEGLHVSDRIRLVVGTGHHADVRAALEAYREFLMGESLAVEMVFADHGLADAHRGRLADGGAIRLAVERAA